MIFILLLVRLQPRSPRLWAPHLCPSSSLARETSKLGRRREQKQTPYVYLVLSTTSLAYSSGCFEVDVLSI